MHQDAAAPPEYLRPDHRIGDAGLLLERDEDLGGRRHLADEHDAGGLQRSTVAGAHRLGAGDDPPPLVLAPESATETLWQLASPEMFTPLIGVGEYSTGNTPIGSREL